MKQGPEGPDYTYYSQRHPENYHDLAHIADEIGVSTHQLGAKQAAIQIPQMIQLPLAP